MDNSSLASNTETYSEREFTSLVIDLYRDCPELWKVKSKDYFNRNKRRAAFEKIVGALKAFKPDYTVNKLKQKINTLRTNFNREHKAIEEKRVSGASVDGIPEPSLWYYNDLCFIKDQIEIAPTETSEVRILFYRTFQYVLNTYLYHLRNLLLKFSQPNFFE